MGLKPKADLLRMTLLVCFVTGVFLLSLSRTTWATPGHYQTVSAPTVTPTPGGGGGGGGGGDDDDDEIDAGLVDIPPGVVPTPVESPGPAPTPDPGNLPDPPAGGDRVIVDPNTGNQITLLPWQVIITPDDFNQQVVIDGRILPEGAIPPANPGEACSVQQLDVIIYDANGNQIPPEEFINPIEIRYNLSPEELAQIDGDPTRAIIKVFDPVQGIWVDLLVTVNPDSSISVFVNYTGQFAMCLLTVAPEIPIVLPETSQEPPMPAMLPDTSGEIERPLHVGWLVLVLVGMPVLVLKLQRILRAIWHP